MSEVRKFKFVFSTGKSGTTEEEIVELPKDISESEVDEEFKEWVWNQLDAYYVAVKD